MFPVMNNLEIKRAKENSKNRILGGGGGYNAVLYKKILSILNLLKF
jgi:hypothetical protein